MKVMNIIKTFLYSCVVGTIGEWITGWLIYFTTGNFLWIYPNSPFITTSLYVIPLWGVVGLVSYLIFQWQTIKTV